MAKYYLLQSCPLFPSGDIVSGCPYLYQSKNIEELNNKKERLELFQLRNTQIGDHWNYTEESTYNKEMVDFNKYLLKEYNFSFITEGYKDLEEFIGNYLYPINFPESLSDDELLNIQKRMNRYHFQIVEVPADGKFLILSNDLFGNSLLEHFFSSKEEAQNYVNSRIEYLFDCSNGSLEISGYLKDDDLTNETYEILDSQTDMKYISSEESFGGRFFSNKKLRDIKNGQALLQLLFKSIGKEIYSIIKLT